MPAKIKVPVNQTTALQSEDERYEELMTSESFTVIDIETTGYSPSKGSEIIEVAAVKIIRGREVNTMSTMIEPRNPVPNNISQITGIKQSDLKGQPTIEKIIPELYHFIGNSVIVAHNASFEERFLKHFFRRSGYSLENEWICTMKLFRRLYPERKKMGLSAKLEDLTEFYGINFTAEEHHRALPDTQVTSDAFLEMRKEVLDNDVIQEELLLNTDIEEHSIRPLDEVTQFNIVNVNYWEKNFNKKRDQWARRLYIHFNSPDDVTGEVYYDLYSKSFIVQRCQNKFTREEKPINMRSFEHALINYLGTDSVQSYLKDQGIFRRAQKMFKDRIKDKLIFTKNLYPEGEVRYIEHVKAEIPYDVFDITVEEHTFNLFVTNEKRGSKYRFFDTPEKIK